MFILNVKLWNALSFITILVVGSYTFAQGNSNNMGWYAGAFGNYLSGELNSDDPGHKASTGDYKDDGPMAGVFVGYDFLVEDNWFAAAEVIIPLYMQKGTAVDKLYYPDLVTYEASYRYALFVAGKWGYVYDKVLPYAFLSVGFANVDGKTYNVDDNDNYSPGFVQSAAATHFVWQIGAGVDYQLTPIIFVGARITSFIAARADHTMPWNEPGPNMFGYSGILMQFNAGYRF
jgi:opacity protein-like surface antigen